MKQFLKNFIYEIKLLWPLGSMAKEMALTRTTEKFDVVVRVPAIQNQGFNSNITHYQTNHGHVYAILD
jgi:hypothetical protein